MKKFLLELHPLVSLGKYIKNRDPMVSTGVQKKIRDIFFIILKKEGVVRI